MNAAHFVKTAARKLRPGMLVWKHGRAERVESVDEHGYATRHGYGFFPKSGVVKQVPERPARGRKP